MRNKQAYDKSVFFFSNRNNNYYCALTATTHVPNANEFCMMPKSKDTKKKKKKHLQCTCTSWITLRNITSLHLSPNHLRLSLFPSPAFVSVLATMSYPALKNSYTAQAQSTGDYPRLRTAPPHALESREGVAPPCHAGEKDQRESGHDHVYSAVVFL